ncbi:MAG TPA: Fe-S protein assembly co-chaperone HscB [Blastocatellia bacterium]|nr:Fe-S protein assembly co-chaperone HscB [Blastocatellia bacterium]
MSEAKAHAQHACRYCGAVSGATDANFCPACDRIQPVVTGLDYFSFFGLPPRLGLDEARLEQDYYALSRRLHPDYFMNASDEQRQASIDRSSLLNDAYRTLRNPVTRAQYLLSIEGYKEAEKKAPPDLLEEVFELNMQIEEMKAARRSGDEAEIVEARSALEDALAGLNRKLAELDARLARTGEEWDASLDKPDSGGEAEGRAALNRLSEVLSHRSYIRNLVRDIKEEIL